MSESLLVRIYNWVYRYCYLLYCFTPWILSRLFADGNSNSLACLVGKTAIVTGGNSGIGYALSTLLASRGCRVIIADVVDAEKSKDAIIKRTGNPNVTVKHLDLSSFASIRKFAEEICKFETKIDILVNNAGIGAPTSKCTKDGLNSVMHINFFGAFLLTHLLLGPLKAAKSARIIFAGSAMAYFSKLSLDNLETWLNPIDFDLTVSTGMMLYQNSKMCNILAAQEFSRRLRRYNIKANSADPGAIRTNLIHSGDAYWKGLIGIAVRKFKLLHIVLSIWGEDIYQGAQTCFHLAISKELEEESGQHYYRCKSAYKPKVLEDRKFCDALWRKTEEIVQLKPHEKLLNE